jgi:hypothetical protein
MRFITLICALLAVIGLGASALATAASASTARPAGHHNDQQPCPVSRDNGVRDGGNWGDHEGRRCAPVSFDLNLAAFFPDGLPPIFRDDVTWNGPRDLQLVGTDAEGKGGASSVFTDSTTPANVIDLDHGASLGTPYVDRAVCEVRFTLADSPWITTGGGGIFDRLRAAGLFSLTADFSFRQDRRGCSFRDLSDSQIVSLITSGDPSNGPMTQGDVKSWCKHHHKPVPVLAAYDVFVQGAGLGRVRHHRDCGCEQPTPTPSPTITTTAKLALA